jgi:hypothetical protein
MIERAIHSIWPSHSSTRRAVCPTMVVHTLESQYLESVGKMQGFTYSRGFPLTIL